MPVNISRKFIDLIQRTTGKWASWDPGCTIHVGDFGKINKETGELEVKGNIYKDLDIYNGDATLIKLLEANPSIIAPRENHYIATTSNATKTELKLDSEISLPGIADASLKGQWSFGRKRGALLAMAKPKTSYIPPAKVLEHLVKVKALENMYLVTQVFLTSAFSLYLSSKSNDAVSLALLGSTPISQGLEASPESVGNGQGQDQTATATATVPAGIDWYSSYSSGLFRSGHDPNGIDAYVPLYMMKQIRKKTLLRRTVRLPVYEGDDLWDDVEPEWEVLDEEGNEDFYEDTIFD